MKSFIRGFITGIMLMFSFFVFTGQSKIELKKEDENWYRSKGWVQAVFDLEMNLGRRIDSVSRLLSLEVNDIESDIELINKRIKIFSRINIIIIR